MWSRWAARSGSKPGIPSTGAAAGGGVESWTLVSTPGFAAAEIARVPMQNTATGAFIPQSNDYLNTEPGPALLEAFQVSFWCGNSAYVHYQVATMC